MSDDFKTVDHYVDEKGNLQFVSSAQSAEASQRNVRDAGPAQQKYLAANPGIQPQAPYNPTLQDLFTRAGVQQFADSKQGTTPQELISNPKLANRKAKIFTENRPSEDQMGGVGNLLGQLIQGLAVSSMIGNTRDVNKQPPVKSPWLENPGILPSPAAGPVLDRNQGFGLEQLLNTPVTMREGRFFQPRENTPDRFKDARAMFLPATSDSKRFTTDKGESFTANPGSINATRTLDGDNPNTLGHELTHSFIDNQSFAPKITPYQDEILTNLLMAYLSTNTEQLDHVLGSYNGARKSPSGTNNADFAAEFELMKPILDQLVQQGGGDPTATGQFASELFIGNSEQGKPQETVQILHDFLSQQLAPKQ